MPRLTKVKLNIVDATIKPVEMVWYDKVKDKIFLEPVFDLARKYKLNIDRKRFIVLGKL